MARENGIVDDTFVAIDKAEWIANKLSEYGAYETIDISIKADIFGFDIADVSGSMQDRKWSQDTTS